MTSPTFKDLNKDIPLSNENVYFGVYYFDTSMFMRFDNGATSIVKEVSYPYSKETITTTLESFLAELKGVV